MIPSEREPEDERARVDQAASDRDLAHGVDRDADDSSREARERTTEARRMTSSERHNTASARDATAHELDLSAVVRDRAAEARDLEDDGWDAQIAGLTSFYETNRRHAVGRSSRRSARDREFAAEDRSLAAAEREADEIDTVTGARRRAPGLADALGKQLSASNVTTVRQPPPSKVDPLDTGVAGS
jgi:hypothetical protein